MDEVGQHGARASGRWPERWRGHVGAVVVLLLVLGVAAVGASDAPRVEPGVTAGATGPDAVVAGAQTPRGDDAAPVDAAGGTATRSVVQSGGSGSRAGGSSGNPATGLRRYPPGVTDDVIRVGGSTFTSGPAAVYGEQIAVGFAAGVEYINDTGGILGRRVELVLYDDGADPAKQLANTKRLVEVDDVFALTMVYAPDAVGDYVASKGIPVFHLGQFDEEFTNPWWFPVGGPQKTASYAMTDFAVNELDVESVAIFYIDAGSANYSRAYAEGVKEDWEAWGVDVPVMAPFTIDNPSCSDHLSRAADAGVDFIHFEVDASTVINCGVEAQLQNYKPPKGWGGYLIGVPVIHEALGDFSIGMYAFDAFGANYDVPEYQEYVDRVSSSTEAYSSVTISYFISALLMRDAIEAQGEGFTREGTRDVLDTFTDWTPGLTDHPNQPAWTWRPDCHIALGGAYVIQIQKQDGVLRWEQITDLATRTTLPPGIDPPPHFAGCDNFTREHTLRLRS